MTTPFKPYCLPFHVGSLPLDDHRDAVELTMAHTPEIPTWAQLPVNPNELMVPQFAPGMPGLVETQGKMIVDTEGDGFEADLLSLYEAFLGVSGGGLRVDQTPYTLTDVEAPGFFSLMNHLEGGGITPAAVKGQVVGPVTFCTGLHSRNGRAIFYHDPARDAAVKLLALKARWQTERLASLGCPVIVSLDEPALAGFGSSDMISISPDDVGGCLTEVVEAVHAGGGLASIHVCANTDWSLIFDSPTDIVNFDAYAYFDRFILYEEALKKFIAAGGMVAWGIVPTHDPDDIDRETPESLLEKWQGQMASLAALGFDTQLVAAQSYITPSCGVGSLDPKRARKVLWLAREVSAAVRSTLRQDGGLDF